VDEIEQLVAGVDPDGSGQIDFEKFVVAMQTDGADTEFKSVIKRSSTAARVASRVGQMDATPERFNLPLAIFTGVVSIPFLALYKLFWPVLPTQSLCVLKNMLSPPPLVKRVVVARKAAHTPAGIGLRWSFLRYGLGSCAARVVYIESTSPLAGLLQVGDQLLSISDEVPGSCEEAASLIVAKRVLHFVVLRVDRA